MKGYDIVALGELLIDFTPAGENTFTANPGGAPANVLVMAAKAGCQTAFIGKVGKDHFGDQLIDTLAQNGVDVSAMRRSDVHTTLAFVHLTENGDRSFTFCRNHSADTLLSAQELDDNMLRSCKVFHFGSLSLTDEPAMSAIIAAIKTAKQAGAMISYDPNWRPALWNNVELAKERMALPLPDVDFMKLSDNEVELLTPYSGIEEGAAWLLSQGMKLVVVTMGSKGCYYKTADMCGYLPAADVKVVDTTGSGDVFTGAMLSNLIESGFDISKANLEKALVFGCTAGSLCATKFGGIPAIPTKQEVVDWIASH